MSSAMASTSQKSTLKAYLSTSAAPDCLEMAVKPMLSAPVAQFGFGSILLVMGLGLIGLGLTTPTGSSKVFKENPT